LKLTTFGQDFYLWSIFFYVYHRKNMCVCLTFSICWRSYNYDEEEKEESQERCRRRKTKKETTKGYTSELPEISLFLNSLLLWVVTKDVLQKHAG